MTGSDFGSAFSERPSSSVEDSVPVVITLEDIDWAAGPLAVAESITATDIPSPQRLASERYGVILRNPERGESLFVGVTRNPDKRTEEEDYYPVFSRDSRRRQHQIFTFEVEVTDLEGNPVDHIPVEVRAQEISGVLPSQGTPVAVYGSRDAKDGVVRTYKVINLRTRSSIKVTLRPRDWCFIATAVYGSLDAPEVQVLRGFRDQYLLRLPGGLCLVRGYYRLSPPIASWLSIKPVPRRFTRIFLNWCVKLMRQRTSE